MNSTTVHGNKSDFGYQLAVILDISFSSQWVEIRLITLNIRVVSVRLLSLIDIGVCDNDSRTQLKPY